MGLRGPKARPLWDRFDEKTTVADSGCIVWAGSTNHLGYGVIVTSPGDGSHRKLYAHRLSYERRNGPIPEGLHLDHLCRNTLCVNPDHLEAVTLRTNVLRGISSPARNARKTECLRGHPLDGINLYIEPGTGYRKCRACARLRDAKRARRRRA